MKNCVILTTTSNGEGLEYYTYDSKNFDLYVIDYTSGTDNSPILSNHIKELYVSNGGYKYHNIKFLIETYGLLEKYDYIWLPDWDITFSELTINKLFDLTQKFNLDLSQPSLDPDSHISWLITLNNPDTSVRITNFVEVMCPLFKTSFLKKVLWTFNLNYSSWGLDFLWSSLSEENKLGIIDSVVVKHERPISSHEWILPNNLNAHEELEEMKKKYNLNTAPHVIKSLI